jgi:phage tail sheath protein FI
MLNRIGVNALGRAQAGGAALQGNVSFAGPNLVSSLWQRLDTRRLTLFILRSIEQHTRWVSAAPAADLAATLERQVWIFLARIHQQGALVGKTSEQAFFARARVAGTPTTASSEASAALTLRIGFALQKANEFVVYEFRYDERGVSGHGVPVLDAERYVG